jgi:DNA-binding NarL/FixJ family response regulator
MSTSRPVPSDRYWRVAVVEDHLLQRQRTVEVLDREAGLTVVRAEPTLPGLERWLSVTGPRLRPHLLVLDLTVDREPDADPQAVRRLVDSGMRVLVLSAMTSPQLVRSMLVAGVGGVVGKRDSEADLVAATWSVLRRSSWVTPELAAVMAGDADRPVLSVQEERALVLYASGLTLEETARSMGVRPDTAKKYLGRVKAKYAAVGRPVRTKVELNREAVRDSLLDPRRPPGS